MADLCRPGCSAEGIHPFTLGVSPPIRGRPVSSAAAVRSSSRPSEFPFRAAELRQSARHDPGTLAPASSPEPEAHPCLTLYPAPAPLPRPASGPLCCSIGSSNKVQQQSPATSEPAGTSLNQGVQGGGEKRGHQGKSWWQGKGRIKKRLAQASLGEMSDDGAPPRHPGRGLILAPSATASENRHARWRHAALFAPPGCNASAPLRWS